MQRVGAKAASDPYVHFPIPFQARASLAQRRCRCAIGDAALHLKPFNMTAILFDTLLCSWRSLRLPPCKSPVALPRCAAMRYLIGCSYPRGFLFGVAFVFPLLMAGSVSAAANEKANRQAREGAARAACLDGNYTDGVAILSKLFVETKDPTYIFNQGRCFEQNRRYEDAIARFQEYLRAGRKTLNESDKAEANQRISDCKEMLDQARGTAPPAVASQPSPTSQPPVAVAPSPPVAAPEPMVAKPVLPPAPSSDGSGLRVGGIVVAAVGVAAAGAALALNLKANSMVTDMYKTQDGYTQESDRKTYETMAWVGYGLGAACVVTGAILYGLGRKAKSSHTDEVALVPVVGPDHAGAAVAGAF
jgi:tetratricopeptide (TPR) repeat protein